MKIYIKKIIIAFTLLTLNVFCLNAFAAETANLVELRTKEKVRIDIVSDVVCPWCAIGYKRLSQAIDELNIQDKVEIHWHPFQLNPTMPQEGQNADLYLMNKLGLTPQELKKKRNSVAKTGQDSGFTFNYFEEMKKPNTLYSHVLLDYAKEFNKQTELKVRLQQAYFTEQQNIGKREVLYKQLKAVGLNADQGIAKLDDAKAIKQVQAEEKYWRNLGVTSIPTMVFDYQEVRRGANSVEAYKTLLQKLINNK